jgi:hypothetical protein
MENNIVTRSTTAAAAADAGDNINHARWDSVVAKSILKAKTDEIVVRGMQRWKASRRHKAVHFSEPEAAVVDLLPALPLSPVGRNLVADQFDQDLPVDPVVEDQVSINTTQESSPILRLPPLNLVTASGKEEQQQQQQRRPSINQQSWAERQVVKVRHRKLWCLLQTEKTPTDDHQQPNVALPSAQNYVKSEENNVIVNAIADDITSGSIRINEAWFIAVDKTEFGENIRRRTEQHNQIECDASCSRYKGWPHFPRSIADKIQQRNEKRLATTIVSKVAASSGDGRGRSISETTIANSNSFARRRRFGKKILTSLLRRHCRKGGKKEQFPTSDTRRLIDRQISKDCIPVIATAGPAASSSSSSTELEQKETTTPSQAVGSNGQMKNSRLLKKAKSDLNFDDGQVEISRGCCCSCCSSNNNPSSFELDPPFFGDNNKLVNPDCVSKLLRLNEADVINKAKKQVRNALTAVGDGTDAVTVEDCHCVHRAVISCLLPDSSDSLGNLDLIRRQLRRTSQRHQRQQQQQ